MEFDVQPLRYQARLSQVSNKYPSSARNPLVTEDGVSLKNTKRRAGKEGPS
jgi:hypothetical protein